MLLEIFIGALVSIMVTNTSQVKRQKRRSDTIHIYLTQVSIIQICVAYLEYSISRRLYDYLSLGTMGYKIYEASQLVYNYVIPAFTLIVFAAISYNTIFIYKGLIAKLYDTKLDAIKKYYYITITVHAAALIATIHFTLYVIERSYIYLGILLLVGLINFIRLLYGFCKEMHL